MPRLGCLGAGAGTTGGEWEVTHHANLHYKPEVTASHPHLCAEGCYTSQSPSIGVSYAFNSDNLEALYSCTRQHTESQPLSHPPPDLVMGAIIRYYHCASIGGDFRSHHENTMKT